SATWPDRHRRIGRRDRGSGAHHARRIVRHARALRNRLSHYALSERGLERSRIDGGDEHESVTASIEYATQARVLDLASPCAPRGARSSQTRARALVLSHAYMHRRLLRLENDESELRAAQVTRFPGAAARPERADAHR